MRKVRRAEESDKKEIVSCILDAFKKDFSEFIHRVGKERVQAFLEDSLEAGCFYLMEDQQDLLGVMALTDSSGRAVRQSKKAAQKNFGFLFGFLMYLANFSEFEINYCDAENMGYIEFVAVKESFQGGGIASAMLKEVISETGYERYLLDVTDRNFAAVNCYRKLGFSEVRREKVRFRKQKGFREKIFMEYRKEGGTV